MAVDDLQHFTLMVKVERGPQCIVTLDDLLPGTTKARQVDVTVDAVTVLHEVNARIRLQQGVQQQAFLHR
ncbi:hypothetical protein [Pseudomonas sp. 25 R 14]|nr:hypothetical protein [Pseudomonas sp. 25 R 14]